MFNWHKKESPILSLFGLGGGIGGGLAGGGGGGGISASGATVTAEGITPGNGYRYHVFTSPGDFTVNSGEGEVEYMVLAGGGSAGNGHYGGGGAGAVSYTHLRAHET